MLEDVISCSSEALHSHDMRKLGGIDDDRSDGEKAGAIRITNSRDIDKKLKKSVNNAGSRRSILPWLNAFNLEPKHSEGRECRSQSQRNERDTHSQPVIVMQKDSEETEMRGGRLGEKKKPFDGMI